MAVKRMFILFVVIILGGVALAAFYGRQERPVFQSSDFTVSASFYPLYFFASEIAGDRAEVMNLTPAGVEPHDYELTGRDLAAIQNSRLLIINGGKLEPWGEKVVSGLKDVSVVVAGEDFAGEEGFDESGSRVIDPHVWLDPIFAKKESEKIAKGFTEADTLNSDYYLENYNKLADEFDRLHNDYLEGLQNCRLKKFVTAHSAFGYLAKRYNLEQVAVLGISPEEDFSAKKLVDITRAVKENEIRVIFFESLISPKLSESLARETGAQTRVLNPLEGLSREDAAAGKNYFTEMRENLKNLKIALQCL